MSLSPKATANKIVYPHIRASYQNCLRGSYRSLQYRIPLFYIEATIEIANSRIAISSRRIQIHLCLTAKVNRLILFTLLERKNS